MPGPIVQLKEQDGNPSGLSPQSGEVAIWGDSESAYGIYGSSGGDYSADVATTGIGVFGQNNAGGEGVRGMSAGGNGVVGESDSGTGVVGTNSSDTGSGVYGQGGSVGVIGVSDPGHSVRGRITTGSGVYGQGVTLGVEGFSDTGYGVRGRSDGYGVDGLGGRVGVHAYNATVRGNDAYLGAGSFAGDFHGDVSILGTIYKPGGGFRIDHPLDAARKYLSHSFVESSDMKNMYDGVAVFDASGEAEVELPPWFETLNTDFRYQLTCLGAYAPVYIKDEVHDNHFKIAGGTPGMKVSWQVTGIRQDAWANAHRILVEEEKLAEERGYYLHPELYGEPDEKQIRHVRYPERIQQKK